MNHNVVIFVMTCTVPTVILLPVCVRLCLSNWLRLAKAFTQEEQLKTRGFWDLGDGPGWCSRSWSCRHIQKNLICLHTKSLYLNKYVIFPTESLTNWLNHKSDRLWSLLFFLFLCLRLFMMCSSVGGLAEEKDIITNVCK